MKEHKVSILLLLSLVLGIIGVVVIRKTPLNPIFDVSVTLVIIGLVGFLIYTSVRWFRKSMVKKIFAGLFSIISLLIVLVVLTALVDVRMLMPRSPSRPLTKTEWIEDFEVLTESIRTHPVYTDSLGLILDTQISQIKNLTEISDQQALIASLKMVSLLNDAHSQVIPFQFYIKKPRYLPIQTHVFEDGLFMINASNKDLIGGRIVSINGHSIESIYKKILPLIAADNEWGAKSQSSLYIPNMDVLKGLEITTSTEKATIEIMINGALFIKELKSVPAIKWVLWSIAPTNEIRPVSWNRRNAENIVDVKNDTLIWLTFNQTGPEENLTNIANKIYNQAYGDGINHVVIDMRNNTGGDNYTYKTLIKRLTETKINITLLTSRKTYSAATNFISELQLTGKPFQIIGEPTGAGHNLSGDANSLFLPNSGMMVNMSTKAWNFIPELTENTIPPDIMIKYASSDYFNNNDPWVRALHQW